MLELGIRLAAVIRCYADERALDSIASTISNSYCRVAPDELMIVERRDHAEDLHRWVEAKIRPDDPHAYIVDHSDGWVLVSLRGPAAYEALHRLTYLRPGQPGHPGIQGFVGDVAAKVFVYETEIAVVVPATASAFMWTRVKHACRGIETRCATTTDSDLAEATVNA